MSFYIVLLKKLIWQRLQSTEVQSFHTFLINILYIDALPQWYNGENRYCTAETPICSQNTLVLSSLVIIRIATIHRTYHYIRGWVRRMECACPGLEVKYSRIKFYKKVWSRQLDMGKNGGVCPVLLSQQIIVSQYKCPLGIILVIGSRCSLVISIGLYL